MIKFFLFFFIFSLLSFKIYNNPYPKTIRIGLFHGYTVNGFVFSSIEGKYNVYDLSGNSLKKINPFERAVIIKSDAGIKFISNNDTLLTDDKILFSGESFKNTFVINPFNDSLNYRIYDDNLIIKNNPDTINKDITIINDVSFASYIAGVIQSESGYNKHPEYYKIQAIISSTYAIKNLNRHSDEKFHLCDEVHCQAYYNKSIYPKIILATEYTRGDIIIDKFGLPINTVFHANCGGMTLNSENVWLNVLPYLKSVKDTHCLDKPGAKWEKAISKKELHNYLKSKLKSNFTDELAKDIFNFSQSKRKFYLDTFQTIHLPKFREDFGLRSAYFDMTPKNDSIIIKGRGYGHGVGLCQEGAMRMAKKGISRDSIIRFYYNNVTIKSINKR